MPWITLIKRFLSRPFAGGRGPVARGVLAFVLVAAFSLASWHVVPLSDSVAHAASQAEAVDHGGHHQDLGEGAAHGPDALSPGVHTDDDHAHYADCGGYCALCASVTPEAAAVVPPAPEDDLRPAASPHPGDTPSFVNIKPPRPFA